MRAHRIVAGTVALVVALLITSCGSLWTVRYKKKTGNDIGGIPFFPLEIIETTTAIYEQSFFELILEAEWKNPQVVGDPSKAKHTTKILAYTNDADTVATVRKKFARAGSPNGAYKAIEGDMLGENSKLRSSPPARLPFSSVSGDNPALYLVLLTRQRNAQPSKTPYYINVKKTQAGSAQGKIELNKDGTLANAEAEVTDKTMETALAALPVPGAVSHWLSLPASADAMQGLAGPDSAVVVSANFTVTPIARRYSVSVERNLTAQENTCRYIKPTGCMKDAMLAVTEVRGEQKDESSQKKDVPKIGFTGEVSLPNKEDNK